MQEAAFRETTPEVTVPTTIFILAVVIRDEVYLTSARTLMHTWQIGFSKWMRAAQHNMITTTGARLSRLS